MLHLYYSILFFLAASACLATADEACFDEKSMNEKYKDAIEKCKKEHPLGSDKRTQKMVVCLLKDHGLVDDDLNLDYDKFQTEADSVALKFKDELREVTNKCKEDASKARQKLMTFFMCYTGGVHKICPETSKWRKQILEE